MSFSKSGHMYVLSGQCSDADAVYTMLLCIHKIACIIFLLYIQASCQCSSGEAVECQNSDHKCWSILRPTPQSQMSFAEVCKNCAYHNWVLPKLPGSGTKRSGPHFLKLTIVPVFTISD